MEQLQKIQTVFLGELEINQMASMKESMTLDEAISFFEKESESMEFESNDVMIQELVMKPLLRMANRAVK